MLQTLRDEMTHQYGPYNKRAASQRFESWVKAAGGRVRGSKFERESEEDDRIKKKRQEKERRKEEDKAKKAELQSLFGGPDLLSASPTGLPEEAGFGAYINPVGEDALDIWPLRLIDCNDDDQFQVLFGLLHKSPFVIHYYLTEIIFPMVMRHQNLKLSASGQELGGDMLFGSRLGFSGTPSDLLPLELGTCQYEQGSDGCMLSYLTSPSIVSYEIAPNDWSVESLLLTIAQKSNPPYHALIDTGALITGLSNKDVAAFLLRNGLFNFEGVVYLDEADVKMILLRSTFTAVPLAQASIPKAKQFAFYDDSHTTGTDISHLSNARAVLTLGKDMTFRDAVQGAFRMRGIGKGQVIHLLMIPEVQNLIQINIALCGSKFWTNDESSRKMNPLKLNWGPEFAPEILVAVSGWLLLNSMRKEKIQFGMLIEQNMNNVWRKQCMLGLRAGYTQFGLPAPNTSAASGVKAHMLMKASAYLETCIDQFRERIDHMVEASVPVPVRFTQKLDDSVKANSLFLLTDPAAQKVIGYIRSLLVNAEANATAARGGADSKENGAFTSDKEKAFNSEQVQEQVTSSPLLRASVSCGGIHATSFTHFPFACAIFSVV